MNGIHHKTIAFIILTISSYTLILGQTSDTLITRDLDEVTMIAPAIKESLPWSYHKETLSIFDKSQSSLKFVLDRQLGLQAFNGENFAQDIRISMRGYGSRSAFGVRGIRLYLDEIPLTSPDGTSQLDEISIYDLASLEIMRSGLAGRFGNASGGAISFKTVDVQDAILLQATSRVNSFGAFDLGLKYGFSKNKVSNITSINHHKFQSKRDFSKSETTTFYNKVQVAIKKNMLLKIISGLYYSPVGEDPGSVTQAQFDENPYQANARNVLFKAGESVSGGHLAAKFIARLKENFKYQATVFYRKRSFEGRLPFEGGGYIDLDRNYVGLENNLQYSGFQNVQLIIGHSIQYQDDRRTNFNNVNGVQGVLSSDQNEIVNNNGFFQQIIWKKARLSINQLLRYDIINYKLKDKYLPNGIMDGSRFFSSLNGSLGLAYKWKSSSDVFANISSSFEMPTLNELTNNPDGSTSFNPSLGPEKSLAIEVGWKSSVDKLFSWNFNVFQIYLNQQIQSYEISGFQGRSFYRNAAETSRRGLEASVGYSFSELFDVSMNYQFAHYVFDNYVSGNNNFSHNTQPIIPRHKYNIFVKNTNTYFVGQVSLGYNGSMWLDDANTVQSDAYYDLNVMLTTNPIQTKNITFGIQYNNVLNTVKYSNFRANATGKRYYEAASPRNISIFANYTFSKSKN